MAKPKSTTKHVRPPAKAADVVDGDVVDGDVVDGDVVDGEVVDGEVVDGEVVDGEVVEGRAPGRMGATARSSDPVESGAKAAEEPEERDPLEGDAFEPDAVLGSLQGEAALDEIDLESIPAVAKKSAIVPAGKDGGALSLRDPLQAYMRDVQRYSLLKPDETYDLAVKYVSTGDVDAARKLVTSNLRLVVKIAFDYRRAYRNILDLIQEGNIGLMQAVKKYDPYRGVKLSSYAAWWIRAYILRFILNNWRLVKLGTTQAQRKLFFNLKKEKARLSAMGIEPTPELIAQRLDVTAEEVTQMDRRLAAGDASLDAPLGGGEGGRATSRMEMLADSELRGADEQLAEGEINDLLTEKIHEFGKTLTGKEAIIFTERLLADEPKTLQELGDRFGVSRERVRQLEKRLQLKIKSYLESQVDRSSLS